MLFPLNRIKLLLDPVVAFERIRAIAFLKNVCNQSREVVVEFAPNGVAIHDKIAAILEDRRVAS